MWLCIAAALAAEPLSVDEAHAALDEIQRTLHEVHPEPFAVADARKQARALSRAKRSIRAPLPPDAFAAVAQQLLVPLHDAHTSLSFVGDDRWLPVRFAWAHDGRLGIVDGPATGEVRRIGGQTPNALLERLAGILPAENAHWVRTRAERLLSARSTWLALGRDTESVPVELDDGTVLDLTFGDTPPPSGRPDEPATWWTVVPDADLAWLRLASCPRPTPAWEASVADLFHEAAARDVGTLVIDVRGNGGGDSSILDAVLERLPADELEVYGGFRRVSEAAAEQRGLDRAKARLQPGTDLTQPFEGSWKKPRRFRRLTPFRGDVVVLVDGGTFSSGNWVAVVLDDNDMAEVAGEPTGNAPSSYGDVLHFAVGGRDDLRLSVSYTKWLRPDLERDPATSLQPDHLVPATLEDRLAGRDVVWVWLLERLGAPAELPPPAPNPTLAPRVVRTDPPQGASDVDPSRATLRVEFSEPMSSKGMALLGGGPSFPELIGDPKWTWLDPTTLELNVALKPGVTYRIGVNSAKYDSLRALDGTPSVPYDWTFTTADP